MRLPESTPRRHLPGLDGLRGVAILVVLLHHFSPATSGRGMTRTMLDLFHTGWIGVDLFFVLSGFLITGILLDTKGRPHYFRNFVARRTLRIAPLYFGVLAVIFGLIPLLTSLGVHSRGLAWLFGKTGSEIAALSDRQGWLWSYLTNFKIGYDQSRWGVVNHLWSLAVEEHFYLVWPVLVWFLARRDLIGACIGCIVAAPVLRCLLLVLGYDPVVPYVLTPTRVDSLAFGALLATLVRSEIANQLPRLAIRLGIGAAVLLVAIAGGYGRLNRNDPLTSILGYSLLAALFTTLTLAAAEATPTSPLGRVLIRRPLLVLGKYSYGIYVLHHFLQIPAQRLFAWGTLTKLTGSYPAAIVLHIALATGLSLAVAWAVYHAYEKPFLKLKRFFESPGREPLPQPLGDPVATPLPASC